MFTFTPVGGTAVTETTHIVRIGSRNATLGTCRGLGSFGEDSGTYEFQIETRAAVRGHLERHRARTTDRALTDRLMGDGRSQVHIP